MRAKRQIDLPLVIFLPLYILAISLGLFIIGTTVYGLYVAFSTSLLLGFLVLIVEPMPLVVGLLMLFFNFNLVESFLKFING